MGARSDLHGFDGLGLGDLVRRREVSALEVVEAAIGRIEAHDPRLNAVVQQTFDQARAAARAGPPDGPFQGVPFLVKDLLATVAGVPTGAGNRLLRRIPAVRDSELVRRWRRAGVVILGKSNTSEFGITPYAESRACGPARNPWDLLRSAAGSSGGSAAAVAARLVPLASGGDGGGSIRIPASACGVFGLKPTRGRTPMGPDIGESWRGMAIEHVLTRSVRDSAALLDATAGADVGAPYAAPAQALPFLDAVAQPPGRLRIAVTGKPLLGKAVDPEVLAGLAETVRLLGELGHELLEASPPLDAEAFSLAFVTVLAGEVRADMERAARLAGVRLSSADFDVSTVGLGLLGKLFTAAEAARASWTLQHASRQIGAFFEGIDVLLTPTLARPPVLVGALEPSRAEQALLRLLGRLDAAWVLGLLGIARPLSARIFEFMPWTPVFNATGQPAMSVPLHWTASGLPVGMHFVGRFGDEATLFRLAGQLEQARPWANRVPPGFS